MTNVTAGMVKELRDKTGAGMMDCKAALAETGGELESAVDWLRKKGLAKAAKKAGRVAAEGLVGVAVAGSSGAIVEINSETDFVARNETFKAFVKEVAKLALETGGDVAKLLARKMASGSRLRTLATASARSALSASRRVSSEASIAIGVRKRQPTMLTPIDHGS